MALRPGQSYTGLGCDLKTRRWVSRWSTGLLESAEALVAATLGVPSAISVWLYQEPTVFGFGGRPHEGPQIG